jgi:hypothetical protein
MNGQSMIVRARVRRRVQAVAAEWGIRRQRIPRELFETLEADFEKHLTTRVLGLMSHVEPRPKKKQPGPKTPRKTIRTANQGADD